MIFKRNQTKSAKLELSEITFDIDGETVPVAVRRNPQARRLTLRIEPGSGALKMSAPPHVGDSEIKRFAERNRHWVRAKRARMPALNRPEDGAMIAYFGIEHRIVATGKLRGLVAVDTIAGEPVLLVPGRSEHLCRRLADFMKARARHALAQQVERHSIVLGCRAAAIRITDTNSRWGSCSSRRTLSFSWRIIMAPPEILDYLAAHEVAHLLEMNHSDRFWDLVKQLCPQMERHRAWLRAHGSKLHAVQI